MLEGDCTSRSAAEDRVPALRKEVGPGAGDAEGRYVQVDTQAARKAAHGVEAGNNWAEDKAGGKGMSQAASLEVVPAGHMKDSPAASSRKDMEVHTRGVHDSKEPEEANTVLARDVQALDAQGTRAVVEGARTVAEAEEGSG